jgi:hypothetical protein
LHELGVSTLASGAILGGCKRSSIRAI